MGTKTNELDKGIVPSRENDITVLEPPKPDPAAQFITRLLSHEVHKPEGMNNWYLLVNGDQSVCPYKTVTMLFNDKGPAGAIKHPCTTECPLASLYKEDDQLIYEVRCHGYSNRIPVTEKLPEKIQKVDMGIVRTF